MNDLIAVDSKGELQLVVSECVAVDYICEKILKATADIDAEKMSTIIDELVCIAHLFSSNTAKMLIMSASNFNGQIMSSNSKEKTRNNETVTYIAQNTLSGYYKIGKTNIGTKKRFKQLKTASCGTIRSAIEIKKDVEKELHILFDKNKIIGEWFELSIADLNKIRGLYYEFLSW